MRKKVFLFVWAALVFSVAGKAAASNSFQFAPPPFPILNLRSVDAERNISIDYIGMKMSGFKFDALNYGVSRAVKYWDRGGFSLGGNMQLIMGRGKFSGTDLTLFGPGMGVQPNFYFDLYGEEDDDFSLPFYFGPHLSGNAVMGSISQSVGGTTYTTVIAVSTLLYGWQAGIQAGVNLGEYIKFIPYIDFSQELGGMVGTSISNAYYSASDSVSVKSMPVASQPGFDFMFRKIGLDLGGSVQNTKSADGSGTEVKTTVFHIRFQKKFRSICGI
ncbi:MAG: hypothetical protein A2X34_09500 [Elusimicrobia bacterium GWC2_51_8]|nr:MAG: hypothetical protein A2X34_09500 [Elusimicrobia bacterium GWC2_51_8]HAF95059.1 hypothetical protein [Elusimicrobiota bacterium]HCE98720.1 hypothetical protein [Elusimicrobiota bacterium]